MPGAQGHSTDPIRVAESPRDAGELVCFVPVASPWSADFIGILLVRVLSLSPAATGRSQDSTWIWLQSASSRCRARTIIICGLLAVGAFIVAYVCILPLLAAPHLPVPPHTPAVSHEGSDWLSQLRQVKERDTEGQQSRCPLCQEMS